jgi:hypothetical protein
MCPELTQKKMLRAAPPEDEGMSLITVLSLTALLWICTSVLVVALCVMASRGDGRPVAPRRARRSSLRPAHAPQRRLI